MGAAVVQQGQLFHIIDSRNFSFPKYGCAILYPLELIYIFTEITAFWECNQGTYAFSAHGLIVPSTRGFFAST